MLRNMKGFGINPLFHADDTLRVDVVLRKQRNKTRKPSKIRNF
jgi:hypothetical protein